MNDDVRSASLRSAKTFSTSRWRPKTLTSAWPVKLSSMVWLSLPVDAHMLTNCTWAFLPMMAAATPEMGTISRVTTASSGETQNIMIMTPISVRTAFSICCRVCCSVCETLSMSLVILLSSSPRGCLSK
ncbi:Uncharacterised protein [Mycobacteroides abscessus subsp. abscessus]|nr:Uncharacterised protein [Mycobacteroides abscessus subsp. abscessus]